MQNEYILSEYPEEDVSIYEKIMFNAKVSLKEDGTLKANRGNTYKFIMKTIYLNYTKQIAEQAVSDVQRVQGILHSENLKFLYHFL